MEIVECRLSVIPVRKEPSDRSEMVSQMIFGETAEILDQNEKWFMLRMNHDQYEGWVDKKQVVSTILKSIDNGSILQTLFSQNTIAGKLSILPAGAIIHLGDEAGIDPKDVVPSDFKLKITDISLVEKRASMFLETPYLWGGRTFMGIDCSGLCQIVARTCGIVLPRDAWQQAETGIPISFIEESQTGDLAFFDNADGRITHVGIIIRNQNGEIEIIHASGKVRRDALDHQGIFDRDNGIYTHKLRIIKRIF